MIITSNKENYNTKVAKTLDELCLRNPSANGLWKKLGIITIVFFTSSILLFYLTGDASAESKYFWIQFDNVIINASHDECFNNFLSPLNMCGANWKLIASINGKQINLFENADLSSVYSNRNYSLNNVTIDVEIPETGTRRLITTGIEQDSESVEIPDITNITGTVNGVPFIEDAAAVANAVRNIIALVSSSDKNDKLGILAKDFEDINNFGVGEHQDYSCYKNALSPCFKDYKIYYSITEFQSIPKNSLTAEVFVHENFTGPSTVIRNNTATFDDIFQDAITGIKIYTGPNYREGDHVEICDRPFFTGNCFELEPGRFSFENNTTLNDQIDSMKFIRPDA